MLALAGLAFSLTGNMVSAAGPAELPSSASAAPAPSRRHAAPTTTLAAVLSSVLLFLMCLSFCMQNIYPTARSARPGVPRLQKEEPITQTTGSVYLTRSYVKALSRSQKVVKARFFEAENFVTSRIHCFFFGTAGAGGLPAKYPCDGWKNCFARRTGHLAPLFSLCGGGAPAGGRHERFVFEKGRTRGGGTVPPGPKIRGKTALLPRNGRAYGLNRNVFQTEHVHVAEDSVRQTKKGEPLAEFPLDKAFFRPAA